MKDTYTVTGMTCEGCAAKVKFLLSSVSGVENVTVDLSRSLAEIQTTTPMQTELFQSALADYPKYVINNETEEAGIPLSTFEEGKQSWLSTYKPLLLIFIFIAGVSSIASLKNGAIDWMILMRNFMAGFFLVFSFFKLLDIKGFSNSYAMYDLLARRVTFYGLAYPFIELMLGLAYLLIKDLFIVNIVTIVVMGFSSLGVIGTIIAKRPIRCACLGAVFNLPMSFVTLLEDLLMIAMAAVMLLM